mgnify:CR=1 FL=1
MLPLIMGLLAALAPFGAGAGDASGQATLTAEAIARRVQDRDIGRDSRTAMRMKLFDRQGRNLSLVMGGEYFLVHARRLLANLKDADDAMARLKRLEHGTLTIGIVSTAKYFVPRLLARFHQEHPGVEVRLKVAANRQQLVALMEAGEVDLSVMGRPPKEVATRTESFAAHPLVFVCPPGHPLLQHGHAPARVLDGCSFVVREQGSGTRAAMDDFLSEHPAAIHVTMEMSSNETIKQAVMAGMGLSLLSLHTIGLELKSGLLCVLDIEDTPLMRMWNIVRLQAKTLSPAAEAFRYFMLEHGEEHLLAHDAPLLAHLTSGRRQPRRKRAIRSGG